MLKRRLQPLWVLVAALLAADLIAGTVAKRWIQEFGKIPAPVTSDTLASTPYTPPALDAQAKPDTVVKPKPASLGSGLAVIYKYPDGTSTTDSVRVLQRPYVATVKQPMVRHGLSTVFRAGMTGFLKQLANEVAKSGVTVNSVCPASIETDALRANYDLAARAKTLPMQRIGRPEELASIKQKGYAIDEEEIEEGLR